MRPRDPQCVVVFWQVDRDALDIFAESSGIGALRLRITGGLHPERPLLDDDLLLDTDHQFVVGTDAGCRYVAAIGFYSAEGSWHELVRSSPITTPVAGPTGTWTPQPPIHATAAPLPPPLVGPNPATLPDSTEPDDDGVPPPQLRPRFRSVGFNPPDTEFQAATPMAPAGTESGREPVTDAEALNLIVWESIPYHGAPNSGEAAHWLARRPAAGPGTADFRPADRSTAEDAVLPLPSSGDHAGTPPARPGFWFEVNAELIVYGRTERDAQVAIGGRPIRLRADGSFSYRFSLPDGDYELPVVAVNARQDDGRGRAGGMTSGLRHSPKDRLQVP